jgi:RNA polymerase sigma-70 factor (ECF subfamily)
LEPDDHELVEQARRGSQPAFRLLVERHQRKVLAMALGMLKDPDAAKDVVQDAFVKVYQHLDEFQGASAFYTWLYRIALNLCIDRARRAKRFSEVEFDDGIAHGGEGYEVSPERLGFDPQRALADKEIRQRVLAALDELSPNHKAAILMREVDGLSYKEIAEAMGCSQGTVMSRLFHARKRMQELLRPLVGDRAGGERAGEAPENVKVR